MNCGVSPTLFRISSNDESTRNMDWHILTFPSEAAACRGVFPCSFLISSAFLRSLCAEINSTSCSTMSSWTLETAMCNAVSPDLMILATCTDGLFLYILITVFHSPFMAHLNSSFSSLIASISFLPLRIGS
ncbi:Replicase large subunit [Gossypium arboreum]|uniref:Replicase large subunit n=1 Tax=Gossypium arboreum TaxID=29729 RepID=A0A0B0PE70_GOSAR|nr:Replicase large subunit [Gossypium arboreum]